MIFKGLCDELVQRVAKYCSDGGPLPEEFKDIEAICNSIIGSKEQLTSFYIHTRVQLQQACAVVIGAGPKNRELIQLAFLLAQSTTFDNNTLARIYEQEKRLSDEQLLARISVFLTK